MYIPHIHTQIHKCTHTHISETGENCLFLSKNIDIDMNSSESKQKHGVKRKNTVNGYFYVSTMKYLHKVEKARKSILCPKSKDFTSLSGFIYEG